MHFQFPAHLFVPLILSALLQGESSQLIGSLLHQVDVADGIGQGFDHVWGAEETWLFLGPAGIWGFAHFETHPRMCRGRSPSLPRTRTGQVKSEPGSSHSSNWCSGNLQKKRWPRVQHCRMDLLILCFKSHLDGWLTRGWFGGRWTSLPPQTRLSLSKPAWAKQPEERKEPV